MAQKTLIGGTAYELVNGKTLIGGTAYTISGGKTLVGGTDYEINLKKKFQVGIKLGKKSSTASNNGSVSISSSDGQSMKVPSYAGNSTTRTVIQGTQLTITAAASGSGRGYGTIYLNDSQVAKSSKASSVDYTYTVESNVTITVYLGYDNSGSTSNGAANVYIVES